ncbi:hypothetical protein BSM4216_3741 [Bacillus smithii]|nr:hypothetical protein BSM4216_3741 [Bacillus smithii]
MHARKAGNSQQIRLDDKKSFKHFVEMFHVKHFDFCCYLSKE